MLGLGLATFVFVIKDILKYNACEQKRSPAFYKIGARAEFILVFKELYFEFRIVHGSKHCFVLG